MSRRAASWLARSALLNAFPTPAASRATACARTRCRSLSSVRAPSRSRPRTRARTASRTATWITLVGMIGRESSRTELLAARAVQRGPRRPLRRALRRLLQRGAGRARGRGRHAGRVKRRPPAAVVVLSQLQVVAPAVHSHGYVVDAGPGVEPGAQGPESAVVGGHGAQAAKPIATRRSWQRWPGTRHSSRTSGGVLSSTSA